MTLSKCHTTTFQKNKTYRSPLATESKDLQTNLKFVLSCGETNLKISYNKTESHNGTFCSFQTPAKFHWKFDEIYMKFMRPQAYREISWKIHHSNTGELRQFERPACLRYLKFIRDISPQSNLPLLPSRWAVPDYFHRNFTENSGKTHLTGDFWVGTECPQYIYTSSSRCDMKNCVTRPVMISL